MALVIFESDRSFENEIYFVSLFSLSVDDISIVKVNRSEMWKYIHDAIDGLEDEQMETADHFMMELDHELRLESVWQLS